MRAMVLTAIGSPLVLEDIPPPPMGEGDILVEVSACALCRTDLHIIEGELPPPHLPLIIGHQIVGKIIEHGKKATHLRIGQRVGIPWMSATCSHCFYCCRGQENLCDTPQYTGFHRNGGLAQMVSAPADYAIALPEGYDDLTLAPFLCAGLIGFRAWRHTHMQPGFICGLYGFGNSAHLVTQLITYHGGDAFAFTRPEDTASQQFALSLGARWAGGTDETPPEPLDAAIVFAPVGELVVKALQAVRKGGRVVTAGIHMSDIPSFSYKHLWQERSIQSVANLTHKDGEDFFHLLETMPLKSHIQSYPLERANDALQDLRSGLIQGAAVIDFRKGHVAS